MAVVVTSNTQLSQHRGGYVIVTCARCHHRRDIRVEALAPLVGWETALRRAADRFRCSVCQAKNAELTIGYDHKPRGWTANPS